MFKILNYIALHLVYALDHGDSCGEDDIADCPISPLLSDHNLPDLDIPMSNIFKYPYKISSMQNIWIS